MPTENTYKRILKPDPDAPPIQRDLEVIADEIKNYKQQTGEGIYEMGMRLIEGKAQLEHGQFLDWLRDDRISFSERTANRFMRLAKEYPNPTALSDLGMTKALTLLSLPRDERDAFIADTHEVGGTAKTVGEMSCRELEKAVRERTGKQGAPSSEDEESDEPSDFDPTQEQEDSDPVTVLMGNLLHLEKATGDILEAIAGIGDNYDDCGELYDQLRKILNEALQKLPPRGQS